MTPTPARDETGLFKQKDGRLYRTGVTTLEEDVSRIYLFHELYTPDTLEHELLGHFYLAAKVAPYAHESKPWAPNPMTGDDPEYRLSKGHGIVGPDAKIYEGRVWNFLEFLKKN